MIRFDFQMSVFRRGTPYRAAICSTLALLFCAIARANDNADLRTWRDRGGKSEIRATLAKTTAETVVLRRADGVELTVARDRLSENDRRFVTEHVATLLPEAPIGGGSEKRNPAADHFVAVTWEKNQKTYFLPGLVFHSDGKTSYVVTPRSRETAMPDDGNFVIRWRREGVLHETVSTGMTNVSQRHRWVLTGEAAKLPAPFPRTSVVDALKPALGMPVEVVGYTVGLDHEQRAKGAFSDIRRPAQVRRVDRTAQGKIVSLHLEGQQLNYVDWSLVATADGQILALLFQSGAEPSSAPNDVTVGVSMDSPSNQSLAIERLDQSRRRSSLLAKLAAERFRAASGPSTVVAFQREHSSLPCQIGLVTTQSSSCCRTTTSACRSPHRPASPEVGNRKARHGGGYRA